jgi:hypothetical protein|tara:strand:- start:2157 stop:2378 length:222 start_codon:yes stop_codon:yes gene_type:complete
MEISVDICFINKYNRYLVNRVEREIMIKYVLRNVVNDQLINCKPFDTMVDALNYRMTYLERDTAWVDEIEINK